MRIAVVQTSPVFGETAGNLRDAISLMESSRADLYVLPELFATGYNFIDGRELALLAESPEGPTFLQISNFASRRSCFVAYGFAERSSVIFNSSALVGPAGLVGVYRKVHLYYREKVLFAPGDRGFPVYDLPFGRIGMMVCFDWMFPESARTLALKGAQVIAHPSNLVLPHCPDAMVTRCLENRVFAATANRVGRENRGGIDLRYIGKSEIVSPRGEILIRMGGEETGIQVAEVDTALAKEKSINEFNDLFKDRTPDSYSTLSPGLI